MVGNAKAYMDYVLLIWSIMTNECIKFFSNIRPMKEIAKKLYSLNGGIPLLNIIDNCR